jgi:transposase
MLMETLQAENDALRRENEELKREIAQLKAKLAELEPAMARMSQKEVKPPAFVKANKVGQEKKPRRKRDGKHNHGRKREEPTQTEIHRLEACPSCGGELTNHRQSYSRQIIDIPEPQPIEVVEHQVVQGWCEACQQWHTPEVKWSASVGQGRMGERLTGLVGYMRSFLRLPYRLIQAFLEAVYRLKVSVGELVNLSQKVEQKLTGEVARIQEEARASPYVHMDETGWRENGQNGYIWCMVADTPQPVRYFEYHRSRAGQVVQSMLGEEFKGVVVSDFYSAYNIYQGLHQRCWVHLLRDLAEIRQEHPENGEIVAWSVGVKNLYYLGRSMLSTADKDKKAYEQGTPEDNLTSLTNKIYLMGMMYAAKKGHPCQALAKRLLRHMDELFQFVVHPNLAPDNNLAERSLRSLVVQRKISGGSRSSSGSETTMRLATLFQTWSARGLSPLFECWRLLGYQPVWAISPEV